MSHFMFNASKDFMDFLHLYGTVVVDENNKVYVNLPQWIEIIDRERGLIFMHHSSDLPQSIRELVFKTEDKSKIK